MHRFGSFLLFLAETFSRLEKARIVWSGFMQECIKVGYQSLLIVVIISTFTGAVSAVQTSYNLDDPLIQDHYVALVVRDTLFSMIPTLVALIYAGKVGSHIAGELGTMRITEQIDALEIMGVNSKSFLVFPKIMASMFMFPMLVVIACFMSLLGGFLTVSLLGPLTEPQYIQGIRIDFNGYVIVIILVKAVVFGLLIPAISSFQGFHVKGGAFEVGRAGTQAVVRCCMFILIGDYIITELMTND